MVEQAQDKEQHVGRPALMTSNAFIDMTRRNSMRNTLLIISSLLLTVCAAPASADKWVNGYIKKTALMFRAI